MARGTIFARFGHIWYGQPTRRCCFGQLSLNGIHLAGHLHLDMAFGRAFHLGIRLDVVPQAQKIVYPTGPSCLR